MYRLVAVHVPPGDFWKNPETWEILGMEKFYTSSTIQNTYSYNIRVKMHIKNSPNLDFTL